MGKYPFFGAGPDHFPVHATEYGFSKGRESHTLWLNYGAEVGIPGLILIMTYYGLCIFRLWRLLRDPDPGIDDGLRSLARMVIAGLTGFGVAAQFIALDLLETPYYVAMIGAATLMFSSRRIAGQLSNMCRASL